MIIRNRVAGMCSCFSFIHKRYIMNFRNSHITSWIFQEFTPTLPCNH
nr:MAG TPA: hypothetical protein [Herelleviridae sp.]